MWRHVIPLLVVLSSATACATNTASTRSFRSAGSDIITAAEIVAARVTDVYQAVSQLRPEFLNRRSREPMVSGRSGSIAVYLNEMPVGGSEALKTIPLDEVRQIRYMSKAEAEFRWGRAHPVGAIVVTTLKK